MRKNEYTGIEYTDTSGFEGSHLYFNLAKNHDPYEDDLWWNWHTMHKMIGVNKNKQNEDFYGVRYVFAIYWKEPASHSHNHLHGNCILRLSIAVWMVGYA